MVVHTENAEILFQAEDLFSALKSKKNTNVVWGSST